MAKMLIRDVHVCKGEQEYNLIENYRVISPLKIPSLHHAGRMHINGLLPSGHEYFVIKLDVITF
jgi:hypothetical protein